MITLDDIRAAAARIEGKVRQTPLLAAANLKSTIADTEVLLKLELLQGTGSFKVPGATNRLLTTNIGTAQI